MGLFGIVFLVVSLLVIGIGIGVGVVGCIIAAILLGLGVISSSFAAGLLSRRAVVGFRVFLIQCGILAGIPAGAVCAWLAQSFFAAYGSGWPVVVYGALGGAFAGLTVALVLTFIGERLQAWAARHLQAARDRLPLGPAAAARDVSAPAAWPDVTNSRRIESPPTVP